MDATATILDMAGVEEESVSAMNLDGVSLLPQMTGDAGAERDEAFAEHLAHGTDRPRAMVRRGNWKLCYSHGDPPDMELYNLESDPGEFDNLAADPEYDSVRERLAAKAMEVWGDPDELDRSIKDSQRSRPDDTGRPGRRGYLLGRGYSHATYHPKAVGSMSWVFLALGSALAFAVVSALDKILIQRFVPNPRAFIVLVGLIQFGLTVIVMPFAKFSGYGLDTALIAWLSGFLAGIYLVLMFWVMRMQDVSRVVPITSTHPIFVAILAQVFLGEDIVLLAWGGAYSLRWAARR